MRNNALGTARAAVLLATLSVLGTVFASPPPARADGIAPGSMNSDDFAKPAMYGDEDALAALAGISTALVEVGDGGSYVWHRVDGRLSGMAQPVSSFKSASGEPCRHLIVVLNALDRSRRIEGTACRSQTGQWRLEG